MREYNETKVRLTIPLIRETVVEEYSKQDIAKVELLMGGHLRVYFTDDGEAPWDNQEVTDYQVINPDE